MRDPMLKALTYASPVYIHSHESGFLDAQQNVIQTELKSINKKAQALYLKMIEQVQYVYNRLVEESAKYKHIFNALQAGRNTKEWQEMEASFLEMRAEYIKIKETYVMATHAQNRRQATWSLLRELKDPNQRLYDSIQNTFGPALAENMTKNFIDYFNKEMDMSHSQSLAKKWSKNKLNSNSFNKEVLDKALNNKGEYTKIFRKAISDFVTVTDQNVAARKVRRAFGKAKKTLAEYQQYTKDVIGLASSYSTKEQRDKVFETYEKSRLSLDKTAQMFSERGTVGAAVSGSGSLFENMMMTMLAIASYTLTVHVDGNAQQIASTGHSNHGLTSDLVISELDEFGKLISGTNIGFTLKANLKKDGTPSTTFQKNGKVPEHLLDSIIENPNEFRILLYYIANYYTLRKLYAPVNYPYVFYVETESYVLPTFLKKPGPVTPDIYKQLRTTVGLAGMLSGLLGFLTNGNIDLTNGDFKEVYDKKGLPLILSFISKDFWTYDVLARVLAAAGENWHSLTQFLGNNHFANQKGFQNLVRGLNERNLIDLFMSKKMMRRKEENRYLDLYKGTMQDTGYIYGLQSVREQLNHIQGVSLTTDGLRKALMQRVKFKITL